MNPPSPSDAIVNRRNAEHLGEDLSEPTSSDTSYMGSRYRYFVLAMLTLTYAVSLVDRQIIAIMIDPIRRDLHLSDTQIGLLSGLAFGLFYAVAAIPLARLADGWSKSKVITLCLCLWSVATAACSVAGSFAFVFAARIITGASEGGASSTSQALVADYFPPRQRASALGIYAIGVHLGAGASLALGGLFVHLFGWRHTFVLIGLPGIGLALLLFLMLRDVGGRRFEREADPFPPFAASVKVLLARRELVLAAVGVGLSIFASQALLNWFPAYMMRFYGMSPREVGLHMGMIAAASGAVGVVVGGKVSDILARRHPANRARLAAAAILVALPMAVLAVSGGAQQHAFIWFSAYVFVAGFATGPAFAIVQNGAPPTLRSMAAALASATTVVIGQAFGPFAPGFLSDILNGLNVAHSLRVALICVIACSAVGAIFFWFAATFIERDGKKDA
ncbi:MFS transporter [Caballeronia sp. J97]|uniref:MFS transporter n=1 Tax=Caballeronia sp. J97 TaxID=2805429 RepID=UPI002AB02A53|nr:MFS transporter [Caballeronia sp. J97]